MNICIISITVTILTAIFLWLERRNKNRIIALFRIKAKSNFLKKYLLEDKLSEDSMIVFLDKVGSIKYWTEQLSGEFYLTRDGFLRKINKTKYRLPPVSVVDCSVIIDELVLNKGLFLLELELKLVDKSNSDSKKTKVVIWKDQRGKLNIQLSLFYNLEKFPVFADIFFS